MKFKKCENSVIVIAMIMYFKLLDRALVVSVGSIVNICVDSPDLLGTDRM